MYGKMFHYISFICMLYFHFHSRKLFYVPVCSSFGLLGHVCVIFKNFKVTHNFSGYLNLKALINLRITYRPLSSSANLEC